ncbi:MAG TPA: alpha/beta hydrolase-fold protein, partial [Pirellulales bacterium]
EDFFVQEFIPHIESTYRIKAEKKFRAIAGLSMGGYGSLLYSLKHPELFQSCYAMSGAFRTEEQVNEMPFEEFHRRFSTALGDIKEGEPRINDYWRANDAIRLVGKLSDDQKKAVRFVIDCGDDDKLTIGNAMLHVAMQQAGVPHEYRVRDGGHVWDYWKISLPDALVYITKGMK